MSETKKDLKICIVLGINEHKILVKLKEATKLNLFQIMKQLDSDSVRHYSVLTDMMIRLLKKRLVIYWTNPVNSLLDFRNNLNNKQRIRQAHKHKFCISKRGKIALKLFDESGYSLDSR